MDDWLKESWLFQQWMYKNLKDRYWEAVENNILGDKIAYALSICYGEKCLEIEKYKKVRENIAKRMINHSKEICENTTLFSCSFINVWLMDDSKGIIECVFWTKNKNSGSVICIDTKNRKYDSWLDFTKNNVLPECYIVYPVAGRYADEDDGSRILYKNVICEKSVACSGATRFKKSVDAVATVGAIASAGVLACNPVGLTVISTAVGTSIGSGLINTVCAVDRLNDKIRHEGLEFDANSILAVSDVAISAVGTAAIGITGGCKIYSKRNLLCMSELISKIGSQLATVSKIFQVCGIENIISLILKYRKGGGFDIKSLEMLKLMINFTCCLSISIPLVQKLVEYLSQLPLKCVTNLFQQSRVFSHIKRVLTVDNFNTVIKVLFPRVGPIMRRITDSSVLKVVRKTFDDFKQPNKDPLSILYNLIIHLPALLKELDSYWIKSKQQVIDHFGKDTSKMIEKWTSNDGIDFGNERSSYDNKMNLPTDIKNKISETLMAIGLNENNCCLKRKSDLLFNTLIKLILQHELKSYNYAIGKVSYYCEKFTEIYTKLMDCFHYEYFLYTLKDFKKVNEMNIIDLITIKENIGDYVFNETIELLMKCINHLHADYEFNFQNDCYEKSSEVTDSVFKFQVRKGTLNEQLYYDTATEYLPSLKKKITKYHTRFETHFDHCAVITSNEDKFRLIFYVIENGENVDGWLIYVKE